MSEVAPLSEMCRCAIATRLFANNIRWRKITDVAFQLRDVLETLRTSNLIRKIIRESLTDVLGEVRRWDAKHSEMFVESCQKRAMPKSAHLRTFYAHLVWKRYTCEIDDVATCSHLIESQLRDWPLMQFQFACLYAITDVIYDDWKFDKYRRATFKKQLSDHPVYDFWLTLIDSKQDLFFETERRLPNQKLMQCFIFAIRNGYRQLVEFIWSRVSNRTREAIGLLEWRTMCLRARDATTMRFLCENLCKMNPIGTCRIAWSAFFDAFYRMIHDEKSDVVVEDQFRRKFEFLLKNSCPILRSRLLKKENYRLICDAFRYNLDEIFNMLVFYMDPNDVPKAREYVDRILDRNKTDSGERLRRTMLRRQLTIE
ncbi:unnamed protein product [Caenorhabditis bovis]|uniref:Uncharacterized protein n=1 Tax=Caenorhabditis bovis TaxID=2654633 RepID=A0A8S1EYY1_9PELO|nr:unnamed protein product [Caenorhabditis bovis]